MFRNFKNTTEKIADSISESFSDQAEQFLKTIEEIEGEFRYYTHLAACEVIRLYSSNFVTFKKMECRTNEQLRAATFPESSYLEENY